MDWADYRNELGIGFSDEQKFRNIQVYINNGMNILFKGASVKEYIEFCTVTANSIRPYLCDDDPYGHYDKNRLDDIHFILNQHNGEIWDYLSYYLAFVNIRETTKRYDLDKEDCIAFLKKGLKLYHIPIEIVENNGDFFAFPQGAKELDAALVTEPLGWLKSYPGSRKTFVRALQQYANGESPRDIADNLRKALESFLQEFLGNQKNLETNKIEICRYLGEVGIKSEVGSLYSQVISVYKSLNDKAVKHNDDINIKMIEFLLYQTGLLIRTAISARIQTAQDICVESQ